MAARLVRWALVAALCPLFLSASPPSPPPWDTVAWETFATLVTAANRPGMDAVAFETWASEEDMWSFLAIPSK